MSESSAKIGAVVESSQSTSVEPGSAATVTHLSPSAWALTALSAPEADWEPESAGRSTRLRVHDPVLVTDERPKESCLNHTGTYTTYQVGGTEMAQQAWQAWVRAPEFTRWKERTNQLPKLSPDLQMWCMARVVMAHIHLCVHHRTV